MRLLGADATASADSMQALVRKASREERVRPARYEIVYLAVTAGVEA